ncbi:hypothetical protein K7432_011066, partial [Basidiobolus ranarum]
MKRPLLLFLTAGYFFLISLGTEFILCIGKVRYDTKHIGGIEIFKVINVSSLPPSQVPARIPTSTIGINLPNPSPVTFNPTTSNSSCPEGTHDCGFFKCVTEPGCPLDCHFYDKEQSCSAIRLNGVGCIWQKRRCFR